MLDIGVLIQIRAASNSCVIKLNNGTLMKNVPLEDVEEAKDMNDTKEKKSPIRLGGEDSPGKSPAKLTALSVDIRKRSSDKIKISTLDVGDSVRARCNNGSRWFPGKILRVNRDGTYDVEYSDGDIEKKMSPADVEADVKPDKSPAVTKRSSFRLDQKVKARYKGGKKLFPGKIKRVNSDDTYDIRYEDGDEEKRVKAENIQAVSDLKADSDEDQKSVKASTGKFKVGTKVKAHYKKGKKLFSGKISRVRSDGTYDIDYDDGEVETRVEAGQIEVIDDMFADSDDDKPIVSKKKAGWEVGDRVKAYYGKGKRLFPGRISKVHMNGTYDIKYDDGDSEVRVEARLIESEEDKEKTVKLKESPKMEKHLFRVGDSVKAKYKRGSKFFPGKITRKRMDGTFDIRYEDGDVEERVEEDCIQPVVNQREDEAEKPKKKSFEVGDVVKAPFQRGNKLFRGKISRVRSDGTYDVAFDDGDKDTHVPADLIQLEESESREKSKKSSLKVGDIVKARYKKGKKLFDGKVVRVRSDGTYDIEYDDGDLETRVNIEMIEVPEGKNPNNDGKSSPKTKKSLKVGDRVRAHYNKGSKMFSGEITAVHRDGTLDIRYDDGDKEKRVEPKDVEVEEERESDKPKTSSTLHVGDTVEASYKNGVKFFPGKISRVHSDGTYDITFNDGDSERRVPPSRIKAKKIEESSSKKKKMFAVGDAIQAKYKKGSKYFPGKISRIRSDGTYDIQYEDGDSETHVDSSLIITVESETKANEDSPKPSKSKRFEVGDVVKARYKKGTKLFPGKITRVRSDGTYDIKYDDGDTEQHVKSSHIEGEAKADKEGEAFVVGDKVNARYKGGTKRFPGTIVKVRMDGTFDIEYDDGDTEQRVKGSSLELISSSKERKPQPKTSSKDDDLFGESDSDGKSKKISKKTVKIKVGDVVEANFKRKGKFHRGKVMRARSDGTLDVDYDVGASEKHVRLEDIKLIGGNQENSDDSDVPKKKSKIADKISSDTDQKPTKSKKKKKETHSSSESSGSEKQNPLNKGAKVTFRKAEDAKSRRIGTVRKIHSDGSCDVKYADGESVKRIARKLLTECSDSEDSDDEPSSKKSAKEAPSFRRHESVSSNWRRSSKLSKPKMTDKWTKATVLEKNGDGTYTIRYSDGVVEEDVPAEALKLNKKTINSDSDEKSERKRQKRKKTNGFGTESLFLLEQLSMTLFEEGVLKKKPKLQLLQGDDESSSSDSSSSESGSGSSSSKKNDTDKVFKRLFDSDTLQTYKRFFKENDEKQTGKISRSRIISIVENLLPNSSSSINHLLTEWFSTHDDLRTHRRFEFKTLLLAFAYVKSRLSKIKMEQSVATVLQGRFASYHENKRQMELWQEKLGFRLFETLQRHFHDQCLPNMIPSRIRVSEVSLIFEQVARQAVPNKPLEVYFQQQQLLMHHTLLLPEFLCCYYQLYGSADSVSSRFVAAVELRPIAFVASCLFSNGDDVCKRHGDLVRRLSVGRTPAQVDLILRFRQVFESLLSTEVNASDELLLDTSQLSSFAAQVAPDPSQLEPALTTLRKRCGAVSLVEIYGTCGFIIDELTSAPTIRNAIERMRMRVELAEVRRIIGLVRNVCVKILRFPNNADYWRIRADSEAFQQKIGRFDGATSLLEAAGFVERHKTHYELKGARNSEGKRVSALDKSTLDVLRGKCVQLDGELALFDGVESLSSILQRIAKSWTTEGKHFTMDECQNTLKNLSLYIENVLKDPKDSRCWRIREANGTFQRQIGYLPFVTELMASIGFDLVETTHGSVYSLRGTGGLTKQSSQEAASLANFTFTSVSSHMEWFLWRRKQEIDSLLEDEMKYLHDIIRPIHKIQGNPTATTDNGGDTEIQDAVLIKMYPYGGNAMETFNKTEIQRRQLDMIRNIFKNLDVAHKDFLVEADFSRAFGSSSTLPVWSQFEAFDIGNDGKIDLHDVVAALGPLLDHPYELKRDKCGDIISPLSAEENSPTVCEAASLAVGNLRLETSCSVAATGLEALLNHLFSIIQEPDNLSLRIIDEKSAISKKLLQYSSGRELLQLSGFKASGATRIYELQSQHVRFKTFKSVSELPTSLDSATLTKLQTVAAMLAGHYRGLKIPSVSDISAVSRAISSSERCSEIWARVVQLAVKCLDNIENQPENPRFREIHTATNTFSKSVGCVQGGLELLLSIGFRETDSGTLVLPMDTSLDVLKARKLELEVGLGLLRQQLSVSTNEVTKSTQKLNQRKLTERRGQSENQPAFGSREHLEMKKKILKEKAKGRPVTRQNTNGKAKIRPQSARVSDPIEKEILADFPRPTKPEAGAAKGSKEANFIRTNGHTMILATDAASGTDKIVVQKGEFVLRGACIRIGAEIRDLCEERMVIQASNDHTPGLTTLQLGIPLRFFHPAKELVATILLPSAELAKRLQMSDTQVLVRDILYDIIADTVEKASIIHPTASPVANTTSTLVTSFEPMATLPILSSNVRIGPMLRYVSSWSGSEVSVFIDELSDRKLVAYWEGLVFEGGNSNETISAGALKRIIRRNAYLSLLLSTAQEHFDPENDDIQLTFQDFREIFRLPPPVSEDYNEENEHHLQLPFSYLKRHFQVLALCSTSLSSGFKAVSVIELVRRVGKDIIDHPPDISDDPIENQTALDQIYSACQHLEKRFTTRQTDPISWPELVYFIRYNQRLTTPEMFPTQKQLAFEGGHSKNKEVAEVVAGLHSSRLLILFYDGSVDVWNIESCNAILCLVLC
ncbi:hypothetical protein P3T76_012351 [Phytophthora citrophthora]|uniref:EF-hand domain-containing protein n=1 Tax=Phytophthora citrophthora TaxID=4793 RepID=A0AAD9G5S6_9STRA|nr:hypothetical protein P3T76_012351 [Phytophthora citrophthora]